MEESETLKVYEKESRINIVHVDLPECSEKEDHSSFNLDEDAFSNFTNDETEGPLEENSY